MATTEEDDDNDIPQLPSDTLQLLQQFTAEQDAHAQKFQDLKAQSEQTFQNGNTTTTTTKLSMDLFGEDWNASQFWYTDATARTLAEQLLESVDESSAIAVVSAPSVYIALRNIFSSEEASSTRVRPKIYLLEFDERFKVLGPDFIFYDFHHPLRLPPELKGKFDRIICDPPFLSEDCQTKTALTVRFLARSWKAENKDGQVGLRFISCTGERMGSVIERLYAGVGAKMTTFDPQHERGLSNEFRCYANFECEEWKWR